VGVNELSAVLWRERELLELLTFKLEEEQLLLTAGKSRWIEHATREVEQVLDRLRTAGLERTVEVAVVAEEWGTSSEAPLRELVDHAPEGPWADIFSSHLRAMTELTRQIKQLRDENEQFLRAAARSTQETLATVSSDPSLYDSHGAGRTATVSSSHLFDGRL
jgi:flagellar biosynthesis/type III secretory pathway chaperone